MERVTRQECKVCDRHSLQFVNSRESKWHTLESPQRFAVTHCPSSPLSLPAYLGRPVAKSALSLRNICLALQDLYTYEHHSSSIQLAHGHVLSKWTDEGQRELGPHQIALQCE